PTSPGACTSARATGTRRAEVIAPSSVRWTMSRRVLGLVLLACLGLSSVEVAWAVEPIGAVPSASDQSSSPSAEPLSLPDGEYDVEDCPCLCDCACANAQQVTPPISAATTLAPERPGRVVDPGEPSLNGQRGRLLRQRALRELLRNTRMRIARSAFVSRCARGSARRLRIHRGLV